jgi:CRISPR-associated protein Cas2
LRYLVAYDIPDTPRRTRIAKILDDFGDRVQYSVFECIMDKELLGKMENRLRAVIEEDKDSIRVYSLCAACEKVITIIGAGKVIKDEEYYIL